MKILKKVVLVFLVLVNIQVFAQDKAIRLYSNLFVTSKKTTNYNSVSSVFGIFTPSFSKSTESGNFHEIELTSFILSNSVYSQYALDSSNNILYMINGGKSNYQKIGVKYEFAYKILKNSTSKFQPFIGVGVNLTYIHSARKPFLSSLYPSANSKLVSTFLITPRLIYNLNEKWFLDLNIPFNIVQLGINKDKYLNPALPVKNQVHYSPLYSLLPKQLNFKLGIGLRF